MPKPHVSSWVSFIPRSMVAPLCGITERGLKIIFYYTCASFQEYNNREQKEVFASQSKHTVPSLWNNSQGCNTTCTSLAQQMSRKSFGSNAFYMLQRTLLHSHKDEYLVSTDWVSVPQSLWLLSLATKSHVMWWSAICPYQFTGSAGTEQWLGHWQCVMMSLDKQSVELKRIISFSNVTLQWKIWELEKTPWYY